MENYKQANADDYAALSRRLSVRPRKNSIRATGSRPQKKLGAQPRMP